MKIHRIALAIACTLLLAGCLPVTSKTPIGTTAGLGADEALYGTWKGRSKDQKIDTYFHFLPGKDGTVSVIAVTAKSGGDDGGWSYIALNTAKLESNRYMNAVQVISDGQTADESLKDSSVPILYRFGKNHRLTLYLLDEDKTKEAIQTGKIAGTIEPGNFGDVKITADAAALDAFMATPQAAKLFKVFIVLKRVE